jgi:hypothetical protein
MATFPYAPQGKDSPQSVFAKLAPSVFAKAPVRPAGFARKGSRELEGDFPAKSFLFFKNPARFQGDKTLLAIVTYSLFKRCL